MRTIGITIANTVKLIKFLSNPDMETLLHANATEQGRAATTTDSRFVHRHYVVQVMN